jgi:hypothetical protein
MVTKVCNCYRKKRPGVDLKDGFWLKARYKPLVLNLKMQDLKG